MKPSFLLLFLSTLFFSTSPQNTGVYFAPDDHPAEQLVHAITQARSRIFCALYTLTNKQLADALLAAHERKIPITIVVDESALEDRYNKIELLAAAQIPFFVYHHEKRHSLMHHKFAIIDDTVWTGSMNWTQAGNRKNQENLLWCSDMATVERYAQQFELLKKRCASHTPNAATPSVKQQLREMLEKLLSFFKKSEKATR